MIIDSEYFTESYVSIYGNGQRKTYENSVFGRAELSAECPPELVAEVLAVWGDVPTMPDAPTPAE